MPSTGTAPRTNASPNKKPRSDAGLFVESHAAMCGRVGTYQVKRGPTNHCASLSANFTSALMPQLEVNLYCAPRRP